MAWLQQRVRQSRLWAVLFSSLLALVPGCDIDCYERGECACAEAAHCGEGHYCEGGVCHAVEDEPWFLATKRFGQACLRSSDCISGVCLPAGPGNGSVCTRRCEALPCDAGWECKSLDVPGGQVTTQAVCVQAIAPRLCQQCSVDGHCNAAGDACLDLDGERVCGLECVREPCPMGYVCADVTLANGRQSRQCVPPAGTCECQVANAGLQRQCLRTNEHGRCPGIETCEVIGAAAAWGECVGRDAQPEVCSGVDDDCDGLIDANDPSVDKEGIDNPADFPRCFVGGCAGEWLCAEDEGGAWGWRCDATDPKYETCNGQDDNCDGLIDEPFVDEEGRYVHPEHCGACGVNCLQLLPDLLRDDAGEVVWGAAHCELRDDTPTCVPKLCAPGHYPYPFDAPLICAPLISPACQPCTNDGDCRVFSDRCMSFGNEPGMHCVQSCAPNAPYAGCSGEVGVQSCCPEAYSCQWVDGGQWCMPKGGSCTCSRERAGTTRSCLLFSAEDICQGEQTCRALGETLYGWSMCEQSSLVVEVCDYRDNNCDGQIDEGFRDERGRYHTDEHCGACNVNCPARFNPEIQHAIGACVEGDQGFGCEFVGCTLEVWPAEGPCRVDQDCAPGRSCDRQTHYCVVDDCPGGTCAVACTGDAQCTSRFGRAHRCVAGTCGVTFQFHDTNGVEADGCECGRAVHGGADEPDTFPSYPAAGAVYVDGNCDGIDGDASRSLFVRAGASGTQGTRDAPFGTIGQAVRAFDASRHVAILVAAGTYYENVNLRAGVKLYGGYNLDFSQRDIVLHPTWIQGQEPQHGQSGHQPGTVHIGAVDQRTVIAGFMIQGYDVNYDSASEEAAPSSYAVYIALASTQIEVVNNLIIGGRGGDGANGQPGPSGTPGGAAAAGLASWECSSATCSGQTRAGGAAGRNAACPVADGRPGATAREPGMGVQDYQGSPIDGVGGINNTYQHSDPSQGAYCKYDCTVGSSGTVSSNGGDARSGTEGTPGNGGVGCTNGLGRVSGGRWAAERAVAGASGAHGRGGGGGGAGGGVTNNNVHTSCTQGNKFGDLGGSGGGGGSGGCGAGGGSAGGGGGGSFGVFVADTVAAARPVISGNRVRLGFGGLGGDGGGGGQGGLGGQGGRGGEILFPAWCAGAGGHGGRGGNGGGGGGGGGGCGGVSMGIAGRNLTGDYAATNSFESPGVQESGGEGGHGGPSPAGQVSFGAAGQRGATSHVHVF